LYASAYYIEDNVKKDKPDTENLFIKLNQVREATFAQWATVVDQKKSAKRKSSETEAVIALEDEGTLGLCFVFVTLSSLSYPLLPPLESLAQKSNAVDWAKMKAETDALHEKYGI